MQQLSKAKGHWTPKRRESLTTTNENWPPTKTKKTVTENAE